MSEMIRNTEQREAWFLEQYRRMAVELDIDLDISLETDGIYIDGWDRVPETLDETIQVRLDTINAEGERLYQHNS